MNRIYDIFNGHKRAVRKTQKGRRGNGKQTWDLLLIIIYVSDRGPDVLLFTGGEAVTSVCVFNVTCDFDMCTDDVAYSSIVPQHIQIL